MRREDTGALPAFVIAVAALFGLHFALDASYLAYDAYNYWMLAVSPESVPRELQLRGYLFPLALGMGLRGLQSVGVDQTLAFRILASLAGAAVLALAVPATARRLSGGTLSLPRRLFVVAAAALVFPGLLVYPLSDLPAAGLLWLAVLLLFLAHETPASGHGPRRSLLALGCGAATAAAYNTRSIYLFGAVLVALGCLIVYRLDWRGAVYFVAGVLLVTLPQVAINAERHGVATADPAAGTGSKSLFALQLGWGLTMQKYETALRRDASSYRYDDAAGQALAAKVNAEGGIHSVVDYLKAMVRHPPAFMGLFWRHFANGLDVRDPMVYERGPPRPLPLRSLPGFMLLVLAPVVAWARSRSADSRPPEAERGLRLLLVLALAAPALAAVPGAVETRFFLPLSLLAWGVLACRWHWPAVREALTASWPRVALAVGALCAAWFATIQGTAGQVRMV